MLSVDPRFSESCVYPKDLEQEIAAKHSSLTRTLGWYVLGIQLLAIVGNVFQRSFDVEILSIIAGICILKGSQAWLPDVVTFHRRPTGEWGKLIIHLDRP